jgi:selenide,water dikinase
LELPQDPKLIVGLDKADDAGVYQLRDDLAIIQTVDFFTPIVDDPFLFGQIAATNALSDVYAMGGEPICAMNIACFPAQTMKIEVLREILRGGLAKLREAGVVLAGGHTVEDPELKYGLSVTGTIHPAHVLTNQGVQVGDRLVLTKPIGTGIVNTAIKGELAGAAVIDEAVAVMATLNHTPARVMRAYDVHACTDITGFGLLGHLCEMIEGARAGIALDAAAVPLLDEVLGFCEIGLLPGGLHRNRAFREEMITREAGVPDVLFDVLFDPQTSGGLLVAVPAADAQALVKELVAAGVARAAIVGEVLAAPAGRVVVR